MTEREYFQLEADITAVVDTIGRLYRDHGIDVGPGLIAALRVAAVGMQHIGVTRKEFVRLAMREYASAARTATDEAVVQ